MLSDNDYSDSEQEPTTECNTGADETSLKKRGRPKGSKNRLTAEARGLLAKHGLAGLRQLCAIAAGRPVYRPRSSGERQMLMPNLDQMLTAQKAIVDRLVPQLKATELTGADGAPLIPQPGADPETLRKAMLEHVLGHKSEGETRAAAENDGGIRASDSLLVKALDRTDTSFSSESQLPISEPPDDSDTPVSNFDSPVSEVRDSQHSAANGSAVWGDDRIELGRGFFAVRDVTAGDNRQVWRCFNSEGQFCTNKANPAAAQKWFENLYFPQDAA